MNMNSRYKALDVLRLLAAFSVVCIHYWFIPDSIISRYIVVASRFAVPFFFMLTGFFLQGVIEKRQFSAYLKKLLDLLSVQIYYIFFLVFYMEHYSPSLPQILLYNC